MSSDFIDWHLAAAMESEDMRVYWAVPGIVHQGTAMPSMVRGSNATADARIDGAAEQSVAFGPCAAG